MDNGFVAPEMGSQTKGGPGLPPMHFTPTSSSWLNMIERWFRDITQARIRNGSFRSVDKLERAIRDYIDHHNDNPKTFVWTKKAADILEKVGRAGRTE
jgi:hypothetical protein